VTESFRNLIGGDLVEASDRGEIASEDPSRGVPWATIPRSQSVDVHEAVGAARGAFDETWSRLDAKARAQHLRSVAETMRAHADELALTESRDTGRVLREVRGGHLPSCVEMFHYFAGAADKLHGDTVEVGRNSFNFTKREPLGVVGIIIPWNSPLSLISAKAGAALAAGNTVVVKPAEQAACSVLQWGALLEEAGLPPGVVNIVAGYGEEAGDALLRHPGVARVTFTGSTETGRFVAATAATTLKQVHLELGGKSPNIVFDDADVDAAVVGITSAGIFTGNAGQSCIAGSRILVQRGIADAFVERLRQAAGNVVIGDPLDDATTMGPLVSGEQLSRVQAFIDEAGDEDLELLCGGRSGPELFPESSPCRGGYFVEPTLFRVQSTGHRICKEEVFGPVATVMTFADEAEAVTLANDTTFGLAAGVWTRDLKRGHRMVRDIEAGNVWVNAYSRIHWALPFGGFRESGYGKDSGIESVLENTRLKTAWIELS
jgi:acyl-CoA reductase-like NAD-dependent aldehyde dehydrogenase